MARLTASKLETLKSTTAHCSASEGFPADYLETFAEPLPNGECLCCGEAATFTWGMTHGEGFCVKCGWPARLYHFIKTDGIETRIVRLLQYHPDGISLNKKSA
jgi:hypothetical protein